LNDFVDSTGLRVNFNKSNIYPINVDQGKMEILAQTFGCKIGSYPFTYLGLPLGPNKPNMEDMLPFVQIIERRLVSTSNYINQADKLEMVNSVLSSLPTFYMTIIKLPPIIIRMIKKYKKHCFWRGSDLNDKNPTSSLVTGNKTKKGGWFRNTQSPNSK
jgi:hypothetical protein